jgi:hypothetical protein
VSPRSNDPIATISPRATGAFSLTWVLVLCCAGAAHAGEPVYKCATEDGIVYQGTPCGGVATVALQARVSMPSSSVGVSSRQGASLQPVACGGRPAAKVRALWRRTALCLGITDDEVLNLPGWGRPAAIERARVREGWREAWSYASPGGGAKRLSFLNGQLQNVEETAIDAIDGAAVQVSAMTAR